MVTTPDRRRSVVLVLAVLAVVATLLAAPGRADAREARAPGPVAIDPVVMPEDESRDTPLDGRAWGVYAGPIEQWYTPWVSSKGKRRALLDRIARQPKAAWFGSWTPTNRIGRTIKDYIRLSQHGDKEVLVQFASFRILPWGPSGFCARVPNKAQRADYKQWVRNAAAAIGNTPAAIVVQPDSPFATQCAPKPKLALRMIRFATKTFAAQPRTSVYLETGSADWMHDDVDNALGILIPGGVEFARGFAFNGTHYDATAHNIEFGAKVAEVLEARGIPDKHFVINTAQNGAPFRGYEFPSKDYPDNAPVCPPPPKPQKLCVTLGIPPTTDVAADEWGLTKDQQELARTYVDGYLWFGRPWLKNQASPFVMSRALGLARSTPFQ